MNWIEWFRWFPTPGYGKCGGAEKDCSTRPPLDEMDILFLEHDQNLYQADQLEEPQRSEARKESDKLLHDGLTALDPKNLSFYGRLYRFFAILVFK